MLTQIKQLLQRVFNTNNAYRNEVEQFIISKNPQSAAEVEHWVRIFDQRNAGGFYGR